MQDVAAMMCAQKKKGKNIHQMSKKIYIGEGISELLAIDHDDCQKQF